VKQLFELVRDLEAPNSPDSFASFDLESNYEFGKLTVSKDAQGMLHCLFRTSQEISPFRVSRGFSIRSRSLLEPINKEIVPFLDLCWSNPFELRIFASVLEELREANLKESNLTNEIFAIIKKWDYLLSIETRVMSMREMLGLFGELFVLGKILREFPDIATPVIWTGPLGYPHDFELPTMSIEVKTTTQDFMKVNISSLHQLELIENRPLFLTTIQVKKDEYGMTIEDLRKDLETKYPRISGELESRMEFVGYFRRNPEINSLRLKVEKLNIYQVREGFPKLTRSLLDNSPQTSSIEEASYAIDLSKLDSFLDHSFSHRISS
jgi:hypothetical protein